VTTAIILCGGGASRWEGEIGHPKHLLVIDDETLLYRTIRLIRYHDSDADIDVVIGSEDAALASKRANFNSFLQPSLWFLPGPLKWAGDANKLGSAMVQWNSDGRTILLWGDVWFSEHAMAKIMLFGDRVLQFFGRAGPSMLTHCGWGEIFALSFWPEHHAELQRVIGVLSEKYKDGLRAPAGWAAFRLLSDIPLSNIDSGVCSSSNLWTEIDDWTDDFDSRYEYDRWTALYKKRPGQQHE
jgi:hypothetical protein